MRTKQKSAFADRKMLGRAMKDSFVKLSPKTQAKNPVMFLVFVSAILTSILWVVSLFGLKDAPSGYTLAIAIILWFTVLFANFAEAIAEGRGKAQADSLRASRKDVDAHKIPSVSQKESVTVVPSALLKKGELVIVKAGEQIPADGEVIEGAASVDESAITGESAPVIREAGGDRSAVTGGTTVLSDWIVVRVTNEAGESFLDKMIAMVEGAARKKTPNEIALQIFLVALSIIFILVTVSLYTYSIFSAKLAGIENPTSVTTLVALLVCLAPTTIGALLSAIGIAGMSRLNQANVLAMSGRAIEAAGDVDILMLDKTGTITLGNRQASEFIPVDGVDIQELADAAQLSSLADETPEGRSVVVLAKEQFGIRGRSLQDKNMHFVPFTAVTRMSGVDFDGNEIRKGAADAMQSYVTHAGGMYSPDCDRVVKSIASKGGTPLVVAKNHKILGVIYLKDIIKQGVKEKFSDLRKMGIKTIMITGDNPITAAAIAAEAGVDDFLAEATPEGKLAMIRDFQAKGHLVAMTGDGTNDAPALAQADVAVAMNSGTQAAKEAGKIVILDDNFKSIKDAILYGRTIYHNILKFCKFQLVINVAAVVVSAIAPFFGVDEPLKVTHLLFVNLVMDGLGAMMLGNEPAKEEYMAEAPRKRDESIVSKKMMGQILTMGIWLTVVSFIYLKVPFFVNLFANEEQHLTGYFVLFIVAALFNGFNVRDDGFAIFAGLNENKDFIKVFLIIIIVQALLVNAAIVPLAPFQWIGEMFSCVPFGIKGWIAVVLLACTMIPADMVRKLCVNK